MAYKHDDEFHSPSFHNEIARPSDTYMPQDERMPSPDAMPKEDAIPPRYNMESYAVSEDKEDKEQKEKTRKRHKRIKYNFLKPVTAAVMTVTIINSSFGYDPLGYDVFSDNPHYMHDSYYYDYEHGYYREPDYEDDEEVPEGVITTYYHVTYVPTGEEYESNYSDSEGFSDIKVWVEAVGGDPDALVFKRRKYTYTGMQGSEDLILVGDIDALDSSYIPQGEIYKTYRCDEYYEAHELGNITKTGNEFPVLPNLDPDFEGRYAWNPEGLSEEYVRIVGAGEMEPTYIVCGNVWESMGYMKESMSGATYDKSTNTLTLKNFTGKSIDTNLMGNGFTIELIGDNTIDELVLWGAMYGGSVTFTGKGSLTINGGGYGILINAESSKSCIMVEKGVTLDITGQDAAIFIAETLLKDAIYLADGVSIKGGKPGVYEENTDYSTYMYSVLDSNKDPVTHVEITSK